MRPVSLRNPDLPENYLDMRDFETNPFGVNAAAAHGRYRVAPGPLSAKGLEPCPKDGGMMILSAEGRLPAHAGTDQAEVKPHTKD